MILNISFNEVELRKSLIGSNNKTNQEPTALYQENQFSREYFISDFYSGLRKNLAVNNILTKESINKYIDSHSNYYLN